MANTIFPVLCVHTKSLVAPLCLTPITASYRVTSSAPTLSEQRLSKIYTDSQLLAKKPRNYLVVNTSMMWEYRKPLLLVVSFVKKKKKQNQNKLLEIISRVLNYLVNSQQRNTFWPLYCVRDRTCLTHSKISRGLGKSPWKTSKLALVCSHTWAVYFSKGLDKGLQVVVRSYAALVK